MIKLPAINASLLESFESQGVWYVRSRLPEYTGSTKEAAVAWIKFKDEEARETDLSLIREANELARSANSEARSARAEARRANLIAIIALAIAAAPMIKDIVWSALK